jgi:hypothetical protein
MLVESTGHTDQDPDRYGPPMYCYRLARVNKTANGEYAEKDTAHHNWSEDFAHPRLECYRTNGKR